MGNVLHFRGDCADVDIDRQVFGPDVGNCYYAPISATYDPDTDITDIRLRPIMPDELKTRLEQAAARVQDAARIRHLFGKAGPP